MSSEAVAKSVAGSLFHTCADDPQKVERAVQVCSSYHPFELQIICVKEYYIPKKHGSATNLISCDRSAMPRKQRTVAILTVMATCNHKQGSADITVK